MAVPFNLQCSKKGTMQAPIAAAAEDSAHGFLPTPYRQQIHQSKYARWNEKLGRRETWSETVQRLVSFYRAHCIKRGTPIPSALWDRIQTAILCQDVLPSMRALMTAGPALERDHVSCYNCAFIGIDKKEAFDEALYILMCGTGLGFSVETQFVSKLPFVPVLRETDQIIVVEDSKYGWAESLRTLIDGLYEGKISGWDVSKLRPQGAPLKTFGGRSSGPGPLVELFDHIISVFKSAQGRQLTSLEVHSIMCKLGDIVVVGGVRRSAELSLSDANDGSMRAAKSGEWWIDNPHFRLANNTGVWGGRPEREIFNIEWQALVDSGSGERGFFNRTAAKNKIARLGIRNPNYEFGLNPCSEIFLRESGQFCNLSQITVRATDTIDDLDEKAYLATILGCVQSTFTEFKYLSEEWKTNCEEERLLGVGMTGIMDSPLLNGADEELPETLQFLRASVRETCEEFAELLDINVPAATTCVKPAGNSTQLVGAHGSGMHAAHGRYYIRRNRGNKTDPVAQLLYAQGVPCEDERFQPETTWVFSYPMKAPDEAVLREDRTAIEQLEHWLVFAENWCEHNPSMTINVKSDEWDAVGNWVYEHFDRMIGISFLPYDDHTYEQAPYEEVSEEEYYKLEAEMPKKIDWSLLSALETFDQTTGSQELACTAGACEL